MERLGEGFRIGDCEVRPEDGTVLSPAGLRRLGPRPMALLVGLASNAGKVFSRDELMARIWSGVIVSDETLSRCISDLRQALDDDPRSPRYIETLARRGYRLVERPFPLAEAAEGTAPAEPPSATTLATGAPPSRMRQAAPWLATSFALALVIAAWLVTTKSGDAPPAADPPLSTNGIAVLPFTNLSDDPELEYFSDGLSDELIHRLAGVEALAVVARTSAFAFKGTNKDVREIGRELGVAYVLEGSVRRHDDRIRIGAQLIDVQNGFHLFSQVYERPFSDLFAIQDHVTMEVGAALEPRLAGLLEGLQRARVGMQDRPMPSLPERRTDFAAYQAYLQGKYHLARRTATDLERAVEFFTESLRLEPDRSATHSALASVYALMPYYVQERTLSEIGAMARTRAETAIDLDDENAEAHSILGLVHMTFGRDWARARSSFARALELRPGDADVLNLYGDYFYLVGDYVSAEEMESHAAALEPLSAVHQLELGLVHDFAGQYERAIQQARLATTLNADLPNAWWQLCRSYIHAGRADLAANELRDNSARLGPRYAARVRALLAARRGDRAALLSIAKDEERLLMAGGGPPTIVAYLFALAGDDANGAAYIQRALDAEDAILVSPMYFFLPEDWAHLEGVQQALNQAGLTELYDLRRRHIASGVGRVLSVQR